METIAGSEIAHLRLPRLLGRLPAWVIALAAAGILAGAALAYWKFVTPSAPTYVTEQVSRGDVSRSVTATGAVNPVLTITVGSYVSGVITEVKCDFNTVVKKDQLCARIDPRPYQITVEQDTAALETATAQLAKDQANLDYAQVNEQRQANLLAKEATSQDNYDIAKNGLNQARAQVALDKANIDQHQAALKAARINLGYTDITSPVDGIVVSRNVTIGQTVAASFQTPTLFLIAADLSKMQVDTSVSESDIGGVKLGDKARFTVEAFPGHAFEGTVTQVRQAPQTVQNVVTYDVVVTVNNTQGLLRPGMTATMRIITAERDNVLRVPNQALRFTKGGLSAAGDGGNSGSRVWLLQNGQALAAPVKTGLDDDNFTEILSGAAQGDQVIVSERSAAPAQTSRPTTPRFP